MHISSVTEQEILDQATSDLQGLLAILPDDVREPIEALNRNAELLEVVMDLGRRPAARFVDGEMVLRSSEVTQAELANVVGGVGTFDDDNRAGLARTLHRISAIRNRRGEIVGLTCRVGRAVYGTIDIIADIIEDGRSILLLGRPGVGKTTMLREMARVLADKRRVIIVDTSNEIGGDGDIPHPAVGRARRMQVPRPSHQHETMIEAVENHNPEVIIIDEIGREQEASAARTINERGVQLIGTAHGNTLENLLLNPTLSDLVGGIESVTLSDEEARRRGTQKTVLERRAPPTFDVLIEIQDRQKLAVHHEVAAAVDAMLRGRALGVEVRFRDESGKIRIEREPGQASSPALSGRERREEPLEKPSRDRRNGVQEREQPQRFRQQTDSREGQENGKRRVFPYGVARNRLSQAAKQLGVNIEIVSDVADADMMLTLKSYYRRRQRVIMDAEQRRIPIFVLRANTVNQMQNALAEVFALEANTRDPFELAVSEAEKAVARVHAGEPSVDLSPASARVRRYQHQLARQANLVSHSYGREPNRHVRIYDGRHN